MAAGKTTIGRKLARTLGWEFRDTDSIVAMEHGPVVQIFSTQGEAAFRAYEAAAVARAFALSEPAVVALGGGALTSDANRACVDAHAYSIFLNVTAERILARVQSGARRRPMLGSEPTLEAIRTLYEARRTHYERADHRVDAEGMSDRAIVENIVAWLHDQRIAPKA
jgi:shikimate kinase